MSNSPRYLWQKRWRIDADTRSAVHESGLIVRFASPPSTGIKEPGLPTNLEDIVRLLAIKNGGFNAPIMARRLTREATEVYGARPHERPRLT